MSERETWTLEYDDGAVYIGELDENDLPNGHGEKVWPDGEKYVGQWKDNNFNGQGVYHYADGSVYEGNWKDSIRNGYGKYTDADGSIYEGEWKDDMSHGNGRLTYEDGSVYDGQWIEDERHGFGTLRSADGGMYEGQWKADMWHGYGVCHGSDGSVYEGQWKENMWHGKGKMTYPDGSFYDGDWVEDEMCGFGTYTYDDGAVYVGEWKDSQRHGKGKITYATGDIYEGEWKEDMWHGKGKLSHTNGSFYDGEWVEEEMHGYARFTLDDGSIAEGYWEHGELSKIVDDDDDGEYLDEDDGEYPKEDTKKTVLNGYHAYTYYDGSVYEGNWEEDNRSGFGTYYFADDSSCVSYEGTWLNDDYSGYGKLTHRNGTVEEGGWKNGRRHGVMKEVRASGRVRIRLYTEGYANGLEYEYDPNLKAESERRSAALWKQGDLIDRSGSYYCAGKNWKVLNTNGQYEYIGEVGQSGKVRYPYGMGELYWISGTSKGDKAAGNFNSSSELVSGFYINRITVVKYGKFKNWHLEGFGRQLFEDGCYEGSFLGGRYHGEGIWYSNNGTTYMGIFEHNKLKRLTKVTYPSGLEVTDPIMLMACDCPYSYMSPSDE